MALTELTHYNSYGVISYAERCYFPKRASDLECIEIPTGHGKLHLIGFGNNIILSQPYYGAEHFFIVMSNFDSSIIKQNNTLRIAAGARLGEACLAASKHSLSGLEGLWGIPSSIGGAVYMNAGAYGEAILDHTQVVTAWSPSHRHWSTLEQRALKADYRRSSLQETDLIIAEVELKLSHGDRKGIIQRMRDIGSRRHARFPYKIPNAGSVFKRPTFGLPVGRMIEELGLKGLRVGGAEISRLHGGFIVNTGNATGSDILALAEKMKSAIWRSYGIDLEMEQIVI